MTAPRPDVPVIWLVDDDKDVVAHLRMMLRRSGASVDVRCLGDAAELRAALAEDGPAPALVLLDEFLPASRGSELVAEVTRVHGEAPVRLITAAPDEVSGDDQAIGVLAKPVAVAEILALLGAPESARP